MAWLGGWENRRKITISNTNVDAILSNFPILIKISASSGTGSTDITDIFTELTGDANRKKIAITTSNGTTQCYVELERFDFANSLAWFWVKVPSVAAASVTELYIYYDVAQADNTTYVGDTTDAAAQSVWDANFVAVWHVAQDPNGDVVDAIKDSTSNVNHGTPAGTMTSADIVDGKIGKAIDFDGGDDLISVADSVDFFFGTGNFTLEGVVKFTNLPVSGESVTIVGSSDLIGISFGFKLFNNSGTLEWELFAYNSGYDVQVKKTAISLSTGVWYHIVAVRNGNDFSIFQDAVQCGTTDTDAGAFSDVPAALILGNDNSNAEELDGAFDEFRISKTAARSASWIKATYYSNWDELVSFGNKEGYSPEITLPNPFIATASLKSDILIEITNNLFTATSSMSIDEIYRGYLIGDPSPMSAQSSLQSTPQIEINQSLFTSNSSLYVQPEIQLFTESLSAIGSISAIITDPFSVAILPRVYTFTLTGAADGVDDIVIPIKSFQSRLKSGDPTYLSVVIPGTDYASEINLRLNGDLVVRMGYLSNDEIILSEIISIVDFENIIIYDGTTNKTITLDGHRTETFTPKEINLTGSSYKNLTAGKLRYRCTPNLYVRPGDTVNIDNDSFTIENITYSVSPELETFEVSE